MRTLLLSLLALVAAAPVFAAEESIFTNVGADLVPRESVGIQLDGYLRTRADSYYNLDLDRGLTPSGQALFPTPLADSKGQWMFGADMRLRTDLALYSPGGTVAVKVRADLLDNLGLGSQPDGAPLGSTTQKSPTNFLKLKRAWGEVLTPFGVIAAGRMGNQWGLGMLANGGDCLDCDSGDAADRIAFVSPIAGHIWALAYDFTSIGPSVAGKSGNVVDVEPSDRVNSVTFAVLKWKDELSRERRRKADRWTMEYGAYVSYRNQANDIPSWYVPAQNPTQVDPTQVMYRGMDAVAADVWGRLTTPMLRLEFEAALMYSKINQSSLIAGVEMRDAVESLQYGLAVESDIGAVEDSLHGGLDLGMASGDPAPGFGAIQPVGATAPQQGDLDGPQADPPKDNRIDNFRFHPDYRIDRILWRQLIGTVTDAFYIRPHIDWRMAKLGPGQLTFSLAGVASFAMYASSTPGGKNPLGVELDPTLKYESHYGFQIAAEYGALFPLGGLDNPTTGQSAQFAQLFRLRLAYVF
ncbi:MAG: TIGR04551 family protein [Myxococcales bacterium]